MSKSLLILDRSKASITNNTYVFYMTMGLTINKWKLKKFFSSNIEQMATKMYLHIPELMRKTVSSTVDGQGMPSDIVALVSDGKANDDNDRNNLFFNQPHTFHKITVYFTNGENDVRIPVSDFSVCLDVVRPN